MASRNGQKLARGGPNKKPVTISPTRLGIPRRTLAAFQQPGGRNEEYCLVNVGKRDTDRKILTHHQVVFAYSCSGYRRRWRPGWCAVDPRRCADGAKVPYYESKHPATMPVSWLSLERAAMLAVAPKNKTNRQAQRSRSRRLLLPNNTSRRLSSFISG